MKFKSEADYREFTKYLASGKPQKVNFPEKHKRVLNTDRKLYFLTSGAIKKLAKEIFTDDAEGFLRYVKNDSFEEVMIWGLVITEFDDPKRQIRELDKWKDVVDCWALVDGLDMRKLKKSKEKDRFFDYFKGLCYSEKEFVARLGIVTFMKCYLDKCHIGEIFEIIKNIKCNSYYAEMAVAWLLCESYIKFKDETINLLKEGILDEFVTNKTISKCRDSFRVSAEEKERLLEYRK